MILITKLSIFLVAILHVTNALPVDNLKNKREITVDNNGFYLGGGANNNLREASQLFDLGGPVVNPWINPWTQPLPRAGFVAAPTPGLAAPVPPPPPPPVTAPVAAPAYNRPVSFPQGQSYQQPQQPVYQQHQQPFYQQPQQPVYQQPQQPVYQQPQQPVFQQPQQPVYQQPQQPVFQQPQQPVYQQPQQPVFQQPQQSVQLPATFQHVQGFQQPQVPQQPAYQQPLQSYAQPAGPQPTYQQPGYGNSDGQLAGQTSDTKPFTAVFVPGQPTQFKLGTPSDFGTGSYTSI
jgi:hypothetical protein